jgi:hypothetical protein
MNVVIVNDLAYVNGGAGQVALSSARGLADRRHQVTLFSAVQSSAEPMPVCGLGYAQSSLTNVEPT